MSNRVLISADCICDIPIAIAKELKISLMYYYIITEEGRFRDLSEINTSQILEYMETDEKRAHSCAPEVTDYRDYFASLRQKTELPIIHFCMSKKLSRGHGRAKEAAKEFKDIYVLDSGNFSGGMGIMVYRAAEMANAGAGVDLIIREATLLRQKISATLLVLKTDNAYRTGVISKPVHRLCEAFSLHPMIQMQNGNMKFIGLCYGGIKHTIKHCLKKAFHRRSEINTELILLIYSNCSKTTLEYAQREIRKMLPCKRLVLVKTQATAACDVGSGSFGLVFLYKLS